MTPQEKKSRRTCFKFGGRGHYSNDPQCIQSAKTMTDAIKARYRESGEDELAASKVLFEIAVFLDEQSREDTMRSE
jgi:hypothetical protein